MALKRIYTSSFGIRFKRPWHWVLAAFLFMGASIVATAAEPKDPPVEDIPIHSSPSAPIYKEVTSPHPDDGLLDPAGWDTKSDKKSVRVRRKTSNKGSYEVPDGCSTTAIDKNDLNTLDMLHHRFSRGLCAPTEWLDNVFGDPLEEVDQKASSTLRV